MTAGGTEPWLMWGSEQPLLLDTANSGGNAIANASQQLAQIRYKRPDTWTFFFSAILTGGSAANILIDIAFDLTFGVGRSTTQIPNFCRFSFAYTGDAPVGSALYCTDVPNQRTENGNLTTPPAFTTDGRISTLPAQTIQCAARGTLTTLVSGPSAQLAVAAYFAPRTHVRPDWVVGKLGSELDGR